MEEDLKKRWRGSLATDLLKKKKGSLPGQGGGSHKNDAAGNGPAAEDVGRLNLRTPPVLLRSEKGNGASHKNKAARGLAALPYLSQCRCRSGNRLPTVDLPLREHGVRPTNDLREGLELDGGHGSNNIDMIA